MTEPKLTYDKEITSLLVIDPYNDFMSEGGKSTGSPKDCRLQQRRSRGAYAHDDSRQYPRLSRRKAD